MPQRRIGSPSPGDSTFTTSAPRSPSSWPANGPAMKLPSSSTRTPSSGPESVTVLMGLRPPVLHRARLLGCAARPAPEKSAPSRSKVRSGDNEEGTGMDFALSPRAEELRAKLVEFDTDIVRPAEPIYRQQRVDSGDIRFAPPVMEELKTEARKR